MASADETLRLVGDSDRTPIGVPLAPDHPYLRTRYRIGRDAAERIDVLKRLATIDLAGVVIEGDLSAVASAGDRTNARGRIEEVVALDGGNAADLYADLLKRASFISGRTEGASSGWRSRSAADAGGDKNARSDGRTKQPTLAV
jgi:hypothetical protein